MVDCCKNLFISYTLRTVFPSTMDMFYIVPCEEVNVKAFYLLLYLLALRTLSLSPL